MTRLGPPTPAALKLLDTVFDTLETSAVQARGIPGEAPVQIIDQVNAALRHVYGYAFDHPDEAASITVVFSAMTAAAIEKAMVAYREQENVSDELPTVALLAAPASVPPEIGGFAAHMILVSRPLASQSGPNREDDLRLMKAASAALALYQQDSDGWQQLMGTIATFFLTSRSGELRFAVLSPLDEEENG